MSPTFYPLLGILISMSSIQFGAAIAKELFVDLGAMGVSALRLFFAALILQIIFRPFRKIEGKYLNRQQLLTISYYGGCLGVMNLLFYLALDRIPLGIAVALEFIGPLGVSILLSRKGIDFVWGGLAAIGIFLLLPIHSFSQSLDPVGVALALAAGVCWGLYIIFGVRAGRLVSGPKASSIGMLVAAVVVVPFGLYERGSTLFEPRFLLVGIFIAVLSSALPYTLEMFALRQIPAKTFGILMSLEPALATLCGVLYLKEQLSGGQLFAIVCVVVASLGSSYTGRTKQRIAPESA